MSTVAIKITYDVAASPPPASMREIDFYRHEIRDTDVDPGMVEIDKTLGTGKVKTVERSGFAIITVVFNLYTTNLDSTSTLGKLKTLVDNSRNGGKLYIYPAYIKEPGLYYTVKMKKSGIPQLLAVAGYHSGNKEITVVFNEIEKPGVAINL